MLYTATDRVTGGGFSSPRKDGIWMDKSKIYVWGQGCLAVLKVEVFFKFMTFFVIGPILDWIFTTWVLGDTPVFNEGMFFSILSPLGLILTLVLFLAAALWCYYEISCLIHAVYWSRIGERAGLEEILKGAWGNRKELKHISILLAAVYFVLFLPLVHVGYLNSLVPKVEIPRFVIGALQRTNIGSLGVYAIRAESLILFMALALVPLAMILKNMNFIKAVRQNFKWYRLISLTDKLKLWSVFILWFFAESWLLDLLQGRLIQNQDFNLSILKYFLRSQSYRTGLLYWLFFTLLQCVAMALVYLLMLGILEKYGELPSISGPEKGNEVLKRTARTAAGGGRFLAAIGKKFWNSRKHKKLWAGFLLLLTAAAVIGYFNEAPLLHKPWAIGHRGCMYEAENTIKAVETASGLGADYAEIDIQLSSDGIPMVVHDEGLQRLAGVSDKVEDLTTAQLKELTVTSNGKTGDIPTFEEMILAAQKTENQIGLLVELKPTADNKEELVNKAIEIVEKCKAQNQCIFMSLDYDSVYLLKAERPKWWVGYCIYGGAGKIEDAVWEYKIDFLAIEEGLASNSFMEKARDSWLPVYIWTANNYDDMENYLQMGASGLITDMPDLAREEIDSYMKNHQEYYVYEGKGYPQEK